MGDNLSKELKRKINICLTKGIDFLRIEDENNIVGMISEIIDSPKLLNQFEQIGDDFWKQAEEKGIIIYYDSPRETYNKEEECLIGKYQSFNTDYLKQNKEKNKIAKNELIPALVLERQYGKKFYRGI